MVSCGCGRRHHRKPDTEKCIAITIKPTSRRGHRAWLPEPRILPLLLGHDRSWKRSSFEVVDRTRLTVHLHYATFRATAISTPPPRTFLFLSKFENKISFSRVLKAKTRKAPREPDSADFVIRVQSAECS